MSFRFGIGSVPVTLGGLLTANGLAYVVTQNRTVSFDNIDLALLLNESIATFFSIRSLVAIAFFMISIFVFFSTRIGRDLTATGSNRRAALVSGVSVGRIVVCSFGFSATMSALGGALLSFSLASASPAGLADVLVPAITASILGGVSLAGGTGNPWGLAAGVLTLSLLRAGLNALAAPPYANDIASSAHSFGRRDFRCPLSPATLHGDHSVVPSQLRTITAFPESVSRDQPIAAGRGRLGRGRSRAMGKSLLVGAEAYRL
jgi:ribose transport system permease protein